jgi:hypothetical protein
MITEELLNFIRAQHAAQMSVAQMKHLLLTDGDWDDEDINEAFRTLNIPLIPSTPEVDDFLGIFSTNKIQEEATQKPVEISQNKPEESTPPDQVSLNSPPVSNQSVEKFDPTVPTPRHVISLQPVEVAPKPTFDLSLFRKNIASESSPNVGAGHTDSAKSPITVKTKSIAEAWLQGKGQDKDAAALSPKIKGHTTWEGKTPLVAIRTMSSDILLLGKGKPVLGTPVPAQPSITIKEVIEEARQKEKEIEKSEEIGVIESSVHIAEDHPQEIHEVVQSETISEEPVVHEDVPKTHSDTTDISLFNKKVLSVPSGHAMDKWVGAGSVLDKLAKNVQAKSIAEMWLEDANETVQGLSTPKTGEADKFEKHDTSAGLLLRGKGKTIPGVPALFVLPPPSQEAFDGEASEDNMKTPPKKQDEVNAEGRQQEIKNAPHVVVLPLPEQPHNAPQNHTADISRAPMEVVPPSSAHANHEFIETLVEKNIIKRALPFIIGALILILLVIGVLYAALTLRSPDVTMLLTNATQQFYGLTSFAYNGGGTADLVLSAATEGDRQQGNIKFSLSYRGSLQNGSDGYGDGMHHVKFTGGITSNDFMWETDIDADVFVIGQTLYFHVLSLPEVSNADPELFKTYWVAVDLVEIARELALDGLKTSLDEYGGFAREHATFNEAFKENFPFTVDKRLADEMQDGIMSHRFRLKSDPVRMAELIRTTYRKYINKELSLNANQELRFKHALEKIHGDVWVSESTGELVKFAFAGDIDDDVAGVHVKGPLSFTFAFADFNKPIAVNKPSPILTLEETRVRMDDYKSIMEKRARDTPHITTLYTIEKALADYYAQRGRYPAILGELTAAKFIDSTVVSSAMLKTYFYMPYVSGALLMNSTRCTASGKTCAYYHLGVNLEDTAHPLLVGDADITSGIRGKDTSGCGAEKGFACFDVIAPTNSTSTSP